MRLCIPVSSAAAVAIFGLRGRSNARCSDLRSSAATHHAKADVVRTAASGSGWTEVFINAAEAGVTRTTADAVAQGHSLLLLELASVSECESLRSEASHFACEHRLAESSEGTDYKGISCQGFEEVPGPEIVMPVVRLPIMEMLGFTGQALCDTLLVRGLALLRRDHPTLLPQLFGDILAAEDAGVTTHPQLTFTPGEPACNVYTTGGSFAPHVDRQSLTVLLTLSASDAFCGGGTCFWSIADSAEGPKLFGRTLNVQRKPSFVLVPPVGTALVFGGNVMHAARVISAGERSVFVASFSPESGASEAYSRTAALA